MIHCATARASNVLLLVLVDSYFIGFICIKLKLTTSFGNPLIPQPPHPSQTTFGNRYDSGFETQIICMHDVTDSYEFHHPNRKQKDGHKRVRAGNGQEGCKGLNHPENIGFPSQSINQSKRFPMCMHVLASTLFFESSPLYFSRLESSYFIKRQVAR